MRPFYIIFFLLTHFIGYSQTYYLTGRPFPLERNNAIKEVAKQWGIDVKYAGSDVVEAVGLDSLNKLIDDQYAFIQTKKGSVWLGDFFMQVDEVQAIHDEIRRYVLNNQYIPQGDYPERKLIIARNKKRTYRVVVVEVESTERVTCKSEYLVRWTKRKKLTTREGCSLPFQFPENGIILK
jgi:hypothetical protein